MLIRTSLIFLLLLALPGWGQEPPAVDARLESRHLVVGEKTTLTLQLKNASLVDWPDLPAVENLIIQREQQQTVIVDGYRTVVFQFSVSALQPGSFNIPAFLVKSTQGTLTTQALSLRVYPIASLETKGLTLSPNVVPYLSGIFVDQAQPYLGQAVRMEAKIYVPRQAPHFLQMAESNVVELEKDGLAAWRLTASRGPSGVLSHDGYTFLVYTYASSFSPLRAGNLSLGPGTVQPTFQRRFTIRGQFALRNESHTLEFPARPITVRPLPPNPPPSFKGAVGSFSLKILPVPQNLTLGEALTIEAEIAGEGNIDQFPGPDLIDPESRWKSFEMVAKPLGTERRSARGTAEFSQVIRPLRPTETLPLYRFAFFDPVLERYQVLDSTPQAITLAIPPDFDSESSSAFAFLTPSGRPLKSFSPSQKFPVWLWQIIPATLALILALGLLKRRLRQRQKTTQPIRQFEAALTHLATLDSDQTTFFREAARLIEQDPKNRHHPELEKIIQKRDDLCFRQDPQIIPVPEEQKKETLALLKTLAPLVLLTAFLTLLIAPLSALPTDPAGAKKSLLQDLETQPSPELLFNLALCEKALDRPGHAALWAYRYQAQGGDATELLQSLPGLRALPPEGTAWLTHFRPSFYQQFLAAAAWAAVLFVLFFFSLTNARPTRRRRILVTTGFLALFTGLIGGLGLYFYPTEISARPLSQLSVITEDIPLQSQPFDGGRIVRESLVGSLCHQNATRNGWAHLTLPGGFSAWIPAHAVAPIAPFRDSEIGKTTPTP